jgi:hypothetical protein
MMCCVSDNFFVLIWIRPQKGWHLTRYGSEALLWLAGQFLFYSENTALIVTCFTFATKNDLFEIIFLHFFSFSFCRKNNEEACVIWMTLLQILFQCVWIINVDNKCANILQLWPSFTVRRVITINNLLWSQCWSDNWCNDLNAVPANVVIMTMLFWQMFQ